MFKQILAFLAGRKYQKDKDERELSSDGADYRNSPGVDEAASRPLK